MVNLQDLFKHSGLHSDVWRQALNSVPTEIAVSLPDHQLKKLVLSIVRAYSPNDPDNRKPADDKP